MVLALTAALAVALSPFPAATSASVCGGEGIPYPQAALTAAPGGLWLACRDAHKVLKLDAASGATVRVYPTSGLSPWSVVLSDGRLWIVDRDQSLLLGLDSNTGKVKARIALPGLPVVVSTGAGYLWIGFTAGLQVARVDPKNGKLRLINAGDGVSGFATDGHVVYVVSHRDNALVRIDPRTGRSRIIRRPLVPTTGATEHVAYLDRSLWITGRGLGLIRVDPDNGNVKSTTEIGPAGVDLIATAGHVVVLAATATGAFRGDPIVGEVQTVDPATAAVTSSTTVQGTVYSAGIASAGGHLWLADVVDGTVWAIG